MKVKITRCKKEHWWYNSKVGEVFLVEENPDCESEYTVIDDIEGIFSHIDKDDCILLNESGDPLNVQIGCIMANDHWEYVENVLVAHGESAEVIYKCGLHYKTAFEHGFKHGVEAVAEKEIDKAGIV